MANLTFSSVKGDLGGTLINDKNELVGLLTLAPSAEGYPAKFVNVTTNLEWIKSIVTRRDSRQSSSSSPSPPSLFLLIIVVSTIGTFCGIPKNK